MRVTPTLRIPASACAYNLRKVRVYVMFLIRRQFLFLEWMKLYFDYYCARVLDLDSKDICGVIYALFGNYICTYTYVQEGSHLNPTVNIINTDHNYDLFFHVLDEI